MSNINAINATLGMTPSSTSQTTNATSTLTQADFLQLLVTQMTSQDPLSPVSDTDMAAQMAQFSALQTAQTTDADVKVSQANSLLGRTVVVTDTSGSQTSGLVSAVEIQAGTPEVVVNGQNYTLGSIIAIEPTSTTSTGS
jgi:flagellar basal-body rod modification protein FlgD